MEKMMDNEKLVDLDSDPSELARLHGDVVRLRAAYHEIYGRHLANEKGRDPSNDGIQRLTCEMAKAGLDQQLLEANLALAQARRALEAAQAPFEAAQAASWRAQFENAMRELIHELYLASEKQQAVRRMIEDASAAGIQLPRMCPMINELEADAVAWTIHVLRREAGLLSES